MSGSYSFGALVAVPEFDHHVRVVDSASPSRAFADLLEREDELDVLTRALQDVLTDRRGHIVLLSGEAGVGKTTLAERFCAQRAAGDVRILWGRSDSLFTPRPLGPILDIAQATNGSLRDVVEGSATPHAVATALLEELGSEPAVLVLEDLHWADEATLDVLTLLGARTDQFASLVLATYRDVGLDRGQPLRRVIGELTAHRSVSRRSLRPLSLHAVRTLAEPHGRDAEELFRMTAGNPFFLTEVLAAEEEVLPPTVRDAVLARAGSLSSGARDVLDLVAVAQPQTELWLLEEDEALVDLDECLDSGMLVSVGHSVAFRHELARLTVEESVAAGRLRELHRRVLTRLQSPTRGAPDLARLAHHAEGAADMEAVLNFAPAAAERASSLGAHREAAAQYSRALRFADDLGPAERAGLLNRHSFECYLTAQDEAALASIADALTCYRELGSDSGVGATLRWQALALLNWGHASAARESALRAIAVLEPLGPSHELAMSYSALASLANFDEDSAETTTWASRTLEMAEKVDSNEARIAALGTLGVRQAMQGLPEGWEHLEEALRLAESADLEFQVGRTYVLLGMAASREGSLARMHEYIERGLAFTEERDLDVWTDFLITMRAWRELGAADWEACAGTVGQVLARECILSSTQARIVLGVMRARRGDPDPWTPLREASEVAEHTGQLWWTEQVAAAMAEASWLDGRTEDIAALTDKPFADAVERGAPWPIAELGWWRMVAGLDVAQQCAAARGPFALQLGSEWERAAVAWWEAGRPYEAAVALSHGDEAAQRRALDELDRMGANPAAAIVARRLRAGGARNLPRGKRRTTRENAAQLTTREQEVLELLAEGLRNADIATRLVVSRRTVDHHVSAVLRKLDARTRGEAVAAARQLDLLEDR